MQAVSTCRTSILMWIFTYENEKNIEMKKIDYNLFPSFPSLGDSHSRNFEKKKNSYEYDYTCRTSRF